MTLTLGTRVSTFLPPGRSDWTEQNSKSGLPEKISSLCLLELAISLKRACLCANFGCPFFSDFFTDPDGLRASVQEGNSSSKVQISHF